MMRTADRTAAATKTQKPDQEETPEVEENIRVCEVDGLPTSTHRECAVCNILVGPGHLEETADEQGRCATCAEGEFEVPENPIIRVQRRRGEVLTLIRSGFVTREVCRRVNAPYATVCADIRWLEQMGLLSPQALTDR